MARRPWTIVILIVVLVLPILVNFPSHQTPLATAGKIERSEASPPPPYGSYPVGTYSGTGSSTDVVSKYNKTLSVSTPTNDTNDFVVDMPPDWDSYIIVNFTDIIASPLTLDIETNESATESRDQLPCAMSFQVTNSCYLYSIMVKLYASIGNLRSGNDLWIEIYNATNDSGRPKPESFAISSAIFLDLGDSGFSFNGWQNVSWAGGVFLNTSETYNNHFFVVATQWSGAFPEWKWRLDSETGDNGYAWRSAPWTEHLGIDYFLNVSVVPMTLTPAPAQISMQVNATSVQDGVANDGWWEHSFTPGSKSVLFDISTTWPVTLSYTYVSRYSRTFTGTTEFLASSQFTITDWNITTSLSFPSINADANSRTMNFSLPSYWEAQALLNGSTPVPFSRFKDNSTNPGVPGWLFLDESEGAGNGTMWRVVSFDTNYVQTPLIRRGGLDVTDQEVNITDTLTVSAQLTTFTDGIGRLNPYDELGVSLNQWLQAPDGGGLLTFPAFTPTSYLITNVTMRCEVVWNNSLHAGVSLSSVDLVYPTTLTGDPDTYTSLIGDNVNIRVYYYDTVNSVGVPNAEVNVTFSGTTYALADLGTGYYESSINTGTMGLGRGIHIGVASADRPGYSPTTIPITLTLWSKTQLVANWTALSINYTESVVLEVNYSILTPLGEGGIDGALVNITEPGYFSWLSEVGGGNYSIFLDGMVLGVGTHNLVVNASKPGMYIQENILLVTLTVEGEPTTITGSAPASVDGGEPFNVTITYRKQSDGTGITGATISCLLDDSPFSGFAVFDLLNGTYHVRFILNVSGSPATFNITLTASLGGYEDSTYDTLVDVDLRSTTIMVQVLSSTPVVYNAPFELLVTYQDISAQGVVGAAIQGNWSSISFDDNLDGTYTLRCITTGSTVGWWTINFNISAQNYDLQYFSETFYLVWATSLTPQDGEYSPSEYENETFVFEVTFWDTSNSLGIAGATVWAVFQSVPYPLVDLGSGVYQLTLNLTDVPVSAYSLIVYAQRLNYENQTVNLNFVVLAKYEPILTVVLPAPNNIRDGLEVSVTVVLTFANSSPITGADVSLTVWIHYGNGTDQILYSQIIATDLLGSRIVLVQLPAYSPDFWTNNDNTPYLWSRAIYNGTREIGFTTVSISEIISQFQPPPWWLELLFTLLPFIVLFIFIIIIAWAYYAKRVKPKRRAQQQALEQSASQWAQRMMGLMDLRALFVTYSKTGLPIFTYDFAGGEMPSTLLSGFISAVNSFYSELSGEVDRESQLRDIHYKDLHLSLREGQYIVSVLILDSSPGEVLTQSLAQFTREFEGRFGEKLASFDGRIDVFDSGSEVVEESFHGELLLAYACVQAPSRGFSRKIYDLAVKLANDKGHLYLPQLFVKAIEKFGAQKKFDIANALDELHEQGCLAPVNENSSSPEESPNNPGDSSMFFLEDS